MKTKYGDISKGDYEFLIELENQILENGKKIENLKWWQFFKRRKLKKKMECDYLRYRQAQACARVMYKYKMPIR